MENKALVLERGQKEEMVKKENQGEVLQNKEITSEKELEELLQNKKITIKKEQFEEPLRKKETTIEKEKLGEVLQNKEMTIEKEKLEKQLRRKRTSVIPWQHLNEISGNNLFVPKELIPVLLYLLDSYNKGIKIVFINPKLLSLDSINDIDFASLLDPDFIKEAKIIIGNIMKEFPDVGCCPKYLFKYRRDLFPKSKDIYLSLPSECNDIYEMGDECCDYLNEKLSLEGNDKIVGRHLCLAKKGKDPYMWTYYGNGHCGHCLKLKSESIIEAINSNFQNRVFIYGSGETKYVGLEGTFDSSKGKLNSNISPLAKCFIKPKFLSKENEFRFVFLDNKWEEFKKTITPEIEEIQLGVKNKMNGNYRLISLKKKDLSI